MVLYKATLNLSKPIDLGVLMGPHGPDRVRFFTQLQLFRKRAV